MGPFAYGGDQWISYDDPRTVTLKGNYIKSKGYGGAMVWDITFDDMYNECCREPMPLLRALNRVLRSVPYSPPRPGGSCTKPPISSTPITPIRTTSHFPGEVFIVVVVVIVHVWMNSQLGCYIQYSKITTWTDSTLDKTPFIQSQQMMAYSKQRACQWIQQPFFTNLAKCLNCWCHHIVQRTCTALYNIYKTYYKTNLTHYCN